MLGGGLGHHCQHCRLRLQVRLLREDLDEWIHQRIIVLSRVEHVGCVAYPVRTWTDALLGSTTVVDALIVRPVVATARIPVIPRVLARLIVLSLNGIVD